MGNRIQDLAIVRRLTGVLGGIAAIMVWLGWFELAPALGLPTLATAAMVNRDVASDENPGYWLGWLIVLLGLASAVAVYFLVTGRFVKPRIWLGPLYGLVLWLVAGAVVMPLLAWGAPPPAPPPPTSLELLGIPPPPQAADPMHASFMMLDLSSWAPVGAAVAWLLFGGILGAISAWMVRETT
jgi:uncharacterized membrane protein YagU involved in acid resistance